MPKKKKSQLKPVARGFATTSIPKKNLPCIISDEITTSPEAKQPQAKPIETTTAPQESEGGTQIVNDDFDPEDVEKQSLQNLVDKYQDKTEKEIIRTIKVIELDKQLSKNFPPLDIDCAVRDRILAQAIASLEPEVSKSLDESEEKALARLAITYGVLRRLGFTETHVEECLRSIRGVELDEAYDWLYLHYSSEELSRQVLLDEHEPHIIGYHCHFRSIRHNSEDLSGILASDLPAYVTAINIDKPKLNPSHPSNVLINEYQKTSFGHTTLNVEGDLDLSEPISQYVQLKLHYDALSSGNLSEHTRHALKQLRSRLDTIKQGYFFDAQEAEARYKTEKETTDLLALGQKLRNILSPVSESVAHKPIQVASENATSNVDIFDDHSEGHDGISEGLMGLFDIPVETTSLGTVVNIQNMDLPKHWSGHTPKSLLRDAVLKNDKYAVISYSIVSGPSRTKRAALRIRWEGNKTDEWCMFDVACPEESQAEQYIATVVLHSITFPHTEGFSSTFSVMSKSQSLFRLLPVVFRDLWDQLENTRKMKDDDVNRKVWSKLRSIIESKLTPDDKMPLRSQAGVCRVDAVLPATPISNLDDFAQQHMRAFANRMASPAYQEMLNSRNQLPIALYREHILDTLTRSQVLVLSGETGCGKSTQVPAFILEDQLSRGMPCKIYCTEPRRISAISLAQRVSRELGDPPNAMGTFDSLVGYSIRLDSKMSKNTRLAYITTGVALRMLESGSNQDGHNSGFDEISHLIIDEVHERTIESDFLLIVLKSLLKQRSELKVILMSATVDAEKISSYFGNCPMLHIPGRTFPVDTLYLEDAVECTKWTIDENSPYARQLNDRFYKTKGLPENYEETLIGYDDDMNDTISKDVKFVQRYTSEVLDTLNLLNERLIPYDLIMRLLEMVCFQDNKYVSYSNAILIFVPGITEIRRLNDLIMEHPLFGLPDAFKIYSLHSTLTSDHQGAVFNIPPPGVRKIVISTNIAETGITIPDVTCVIDTGKHREMRFDEKRQISRLVETFISKSNAAQRRGRAGRVQKGLCFHLFTKVRHDTQMTENPLPEMMRLSLSDLALRIKIMKVHMGSSIEDVLSRALDPPSSINVQRAISVLVEVGALTTLQEITPMGRLLSSLPTDVHLGKFLLLAAMFQCLDPALTIAATLNSKSPFVSPLGLEQEADRAKASFKIGKSDFLTIHNAFCSWRRASANASFVRDFCRKNYLSQQNLQQIEELRRQFLGYLIDASFIHVDKSFIGELNRARFGRNRNRFIIIPSELDENSNNLAVITAVLAAGLYPKILAVDLPSGQMRTISNNQLVSFHPSSVNFGKKPFEFGSHYLTYFTLMQSKKLYAWETGPVDDLALLLLCGECEFKLLAGTASIDRKIKYCISPKTNVALKILRGHLTNVMSQRFRGKPLSETQMEWMKLAQMVLGRIKLEELKLEA
ncbi:P-loop containing nucleoside triphosphate hydrolase protein [Cyathus striatus]|nr:P-loop containing nucleoside triphosphate hydrolase protein [Cyathus striatus]